MIAAALLISEPSEVFLITLTVVGGVFLGWKLLVPLVNALARRLEGSGRSDGVTPDEVAELRGRIQELESHQGRVLELEERVDFAERLLAQHRDPARLPAGDEAR
jgi:hypothetical protein